MANPTSGMLADVMAGTPPLSASDVDPTKASTLGIRSATSDALVEAFCWSSSTSRASLRPQMPPAALIGREQRLDGLAALGERPGQRPGQPTDVAEGDGGRRHPHVGGGVAGRPGAGRDSAAGAKLNPAEVGDAGAVGAAAAAGVAPAPGAAPPLAAVLAPDPDRRARARRGDATRGQRRRRPGRDGAPGTHVCRCYSRLPPGKGPPGPRTRPLPGTTPVLRALPPISSSMCPPASGTPSRR